MIKNFLRKLKLRMPKKYDQFIHASVIGLILLGTLMISSTSVGETYSSNLIVVKTVIKQVAFVILAYICMLNFANYFTLEKAMQYVRPVGVGLCFMLAGCLLFPAAGGARSWIRLSLPVIGGVTIQPSEFVKVFMIVIMACYIEKTRRRRLDCWSIIRIPISYYLVAAILILFQNDLGSLIVISLICLVCFLIASHPSLKKLQKNLGYLFAGGSFLVIFLASNLGIQLLEKTPLPTYMINRFKMASNPWVDEINQGYQLINSLYAFASGGLNGLGLGQSIQKMMYLPAASTDYILAVTVEELGILGFILILGGYCTIIYRLFNYALLSKREGYKIIYVGTAMYLFIHFVFNVGGVTGFIPLTGIPLLFISSGASSLVSICIGIGICQALCAKENRERAEV